MKTKALAGASVDVSLRAIQIAPHAKFVFPTNGTVKPYVKGGLGLYSMKTKIEGGSLDVDESKTKFGWNLGIGAQAMATDAVALTGELAYHSISTEGSSSNMFTLGVGLLFGIGSR